MFNCRSLPLRQRLRYLLPGGPDLDAMLRSRLRGEGSDTRFELDDATIYFHPGTAGDEDAIRRGALLILKEAYCWPREFFRGPVQVEAGDTVLDLGGNLGTSAMHFAERAGPRGRVVSFEPIFHDLLERNCRENGVDNVEVVPAAVGEEPGEAVFGVTDLGIDSRIATGGWTPSHRVPVTTVDAEVEARGLGSVDFVKVDIEGAEEWAIRGARQTIERFRPKWSVASYHDDLEQRKQHPRLMRLFEELGYVVHEEPGRHIYAH